MDIRTIEPSIEVSGVNLGAIIEGFKAFRTVAMKYLMQYNVVPAEAAKKGLDTSKWYPLGPWCKALHAIAQEVGGNVVYEIGESVPKHAVLPPSIVDIDSAIRSIDVAYHLNHRKNGAVMFDPANGTMVEGIGHYGYSREGKDRQIISVCDGPYLCKLDHGIVAAMAKRFEPRALVAHDDKKPCRTRGGSNCTYVVTW